MPGFRTTHLFVHHTRRAQPVSQRNVGIVFVLGCLIRELLHAQRPAEGGHGGRWRGIVDGLKVATANGKARHGRDGRLGGDISFGWRAQFTVARKVVCFE